MKTPDDIVRAIDGRLADTWPAAILAELGVAPTLAGPLDADDDAFTTTFSEIDLKAPWPWSIPLGRALSTEIAAEFGQHVRALQMWRVWATEQGIQLHEQARRIEGAPQWLPKSVEVPDLDTASAVAAKGWPQKLAIARTRSAELLRKFPAVTTDGDLARALRKVVELSDLDFEILCRVAQWFRTHPREAASGLTPRQVPLEGVHAKWLNKNQGLVRTLAGLNDLELSVGHPPRVHFTYLDPIHLSAGRRRHDSFSVGDSIELPYQPSVVIISENKDTAIGFPPVPDGISVEGAGTGGGTIAAVTWIRRAPLVVYWGDMDADGLRILNEFRTAGVPAVSILMDIDTYRTYQRYGTNHSPNGQPLRVTERKTMPHLRDGELELYNLLTSGSAPVLRVEQERIPLHVAESLVRQRLDSHNPYFGQLT
jgi:hypothetical protein